MKKLLFSFICFATSTTYAQVGIGTATPHASSQLEVISSNKGFLPPRIALSGVNDVTTIAAPATGLLIYNSTAAGIAPVNVSEGYYFFDGAKWKPLISELPANQVLFDASVLGYVPTGKATTAPADTIIGSTRFIKRHVATNPDNGHGYVLYTARNTGNTANLSLNWFNTFNFGKAINGYLLTMTNTAEVNFINTNFLNNSAVSLNAVNSVLSFSSSNIWLGFAKIVEPGNPVRLGWITGERSKVNWSVDPAATEANFATNEPNNNLGNEGYVHIWSTADRPARTWNDILGSVTTTTSSNFVHIIVEFNE